MDGAIDTFHTFEEFKSARTGQVLRPLITSLVDGCHNSTVVAALLVLKWQYATIESDDHRLNETRGSACEVVAWRFLTHLHQQDSIRYLLGELPLVEDRQLQHTQGMDSVSQMPSNRERFPDLVEPDESSGLLPNLSNETHQRAQSIHGTHNLLHNAPNSSDTSTNRNEKYLRVPFEGLNALEIATIAGAKKFLSQKAVQKIIDGIWSGDIVFWHSLNIHSEKKAQLYDQRYVIG